MSFLDWVAVIGALAWFPPIFGLIKGWLTKSEIRIITQPAPELGFTTLGPICNMRIAFSVRNKDIVITGLRVKITHESGDSHHFEWRGLVQKIGKFHYPQVGQVPFEKESEVLAMKVVPNSLEERFIRFQDSIFSKGKNDVGRIAINRLAYLKQQGEVDYPAFLKSQEMNNVYAFTRHSFFWKPGNFKLQFLIEAPESFNVIGDKYSFMLSPADVAELERNISQLERSYFDDVVPKMEGDSPREPVVWNWAYPDMHPDVQK